MVHCDWAASKFRTTGVWWTLPDDLIAAAGVAPRQRAGAAHAAEHASIGLLPLFASAGGELTPQQREQLASTGIGEQVAIPHGKLDELPEMA